MNLLVVEEHVYKIDKCEGQSSPVQPHPRWENAEVKTRMMMMMFIDSKFYLFDNESCMLKEQIVIYEFNKNSSVSLILEKFYGCFKE